MGWKVEKLQENRVYVWSAALLIFLVLMLVTPAIPQSQEYHDFADKRNFFGVPNTLNVISNFPFLIVGVVGFILCLRGNYFDLSLRGEVWGWAIFYVGVAATAFGSSYYHLKPNDARLVWDRLPMTIAFTSIMAVFIIERCDERVGTLSLFPLLMVGVISIAYWRYFDDLRPYALVQFIPCIAIPAMTILLPPQYTHSIYWLWAAGFYLLAKVEEAADKPIYKFTHYIVSGHTLKHLCAAMVPVFLTVMLFRRSIKIDRRSLYESWKVYLQSVSAREEDGRGWFKWKYSRGRPGRSRKWSRNVLAFTTRWPFKNDSPCPRNILENISQLEMTWETFLRMLSHSQNGGASRTPPSREKCIHLDPWEEPILVDPWF